MYMTSSLVNWRTVTACRDPSRSCWSADISNPLHKARVKFLLSLSWTDMVACRCNPSQIVLIHTHFAPLLLHNIRINFFFQRWSTLWRPALDQSIGQPSHLGYTNNCISNLQLPYGQSLSKQHSRGEKIAESYLLNYLLSTVSMINTEHHTPSNLGPFWH